MYCFMPYRKLDDRSLALLLVARHGPLTAETLAEVCSINCTAAEALLDELCATQWLTKHDGDGAPSYRLGDRPLPGAGELDELTIREVLEAADDDED